MSRLGAAAERGGTVEILTMRGRTAMERFVRLPHARFRDDPAWAPPLLAERREASALGIRRVEMSWVLEDNAPMRPWPGPRGRGPTRPVYERDLAARRP